MTWGDADRGVAAWLGESGTGYCGYEIAARPDAVWVLNAMYEHDSAPMHLTHQQVHHLRLESGVQEPLIIGDINLDERTTIIANDLGRSEHPGIGWRRLRWSELAHRLNIATVAKGVLPCYRSLYGAVPERDWPVSIQPPAEGALDRQSWLALLEVLAGWSPDGGDTPCVAFFSPAVNVGFDAGVALTGPLSGANELYDHPSGVGSPSNMWDAERRWITWSDWDLCATKVVGPSTLIERILDHDELEAVRLPWNH